MKNKMTLIIMIAAMVLFTGCSKTDKTDGTTGVDTEVTSETTEAVPTAAPTDTPTPTPVPESTYEFNPHIYSPMFAETYSQEYWDSFYNMCDALRAGEDTFTCASQEIYEWCLDSATLCEWFPAACMKVSGESNDGTVPYENGIGRIYYSIPPEEYVVRQAQFEQMIADILNDTLEDDDDDFEKALKLYDYMESNYQYELEMVEGEGATYGVFISGKGFCATLSSVYAYLLLQVDIDACQVGCYAPGMDHAWTYLVIDGQGYHSDPTWSLKTYPDSSLDLSYFLMDDESRELTGCPVDDLTVPMVPEYWVNMSDMSFPATDATYDCLFWADLDHLDEENKILYYYCGSLEELYYG